MRSLRNGRGKKKGYSYYKNRACMSELWEKVLNFFNYIGDHSGCHQIPERCFTVKGYTFPMCARCTGALLGQIAACVLAGFKVVLNPISGIIMLSIMGADWLLQRLGIKQSTNFRRFITGIIGGFGLFTLYFNIGIFIFKIIF